MKRTTIVTAKLKDEFFNLILNGKKKYEIRDESFGGAVAIRYISASTGNELGIFLLGRQRVLDRSNDEKTIKLSGISVEQFYQLFPTVDNGGPEKLWIVEITGQSDLQTLFGKDS